MNLPLSSEDPSPFDQTYPLLPAAELLQAIRGQHSDSSTVMAIRAAELGRVYQRWFNRQATPGHCKRQVVETVAAIDSWVSGRIPNPRPGVPQTTDTVGGIIARVAEAWGYACWTLQHTDDEDQRHHAWCHLAEMRNGYHDAATQVAGGLIALPSSWPPLLGLFVGR